MTARNQVLVESIQAALGDKVVSLTDARGELALVVRAGDLLGTMTALRDSVELRFEQLMDLCGVDYSAFGAPASTNEGPPARDGNLNASGVEPSGEGVGAVSGYASGAADTPAAPVPPSDGVRFAVVYHLLSLAHNWRLRVRTFAADDDFPVVNSVIGIWPAANWFEREAFDLYGIVFDGHPDLRRILTDYGFIGHPFRKDFPISGNVEMRYDPDQQRVIYQPVTIEPREITPRIVREEHYADSEGFRKG